MIEKYCIYGADIKANEFWLCKQKDDTAQIVPSNIFNYKKTGTTCLTSWGTLLTLKKRDNLD